MALAGADEQHVTAVGQVPVGLRSHLRGTPCRTVITDLTLRVAAADASFSPDLMVTCRAANVADPLLKRQPALVVELRSPGTTAFDRGDKSAARRTPPSLREYLRVDTGSRRGDLDRKGVDGLWVLQPFAHGQAVLIDRMGPAQSAQAPRDEVGPATVG